MCTDNSYTRQGQKYLDGHDNVVALKRVVSKRAWFVYLQLEADVNKRDFALVDAAIRLELRRR